MAEDILKEEIVEMRASAIRQRSLARISVLLWCIAGLVCMMNVAVCFITIPDSAAITSPAILSGMKVPYALSVLSLIVLPLAVLICSLFITIVPFKSLSYSRRVKLVFPALLLLMESYLLVKLIAEFYTY